MMVIRLISIAMALTIAFPLLGNAANNTTDCVPDDCKNFGNILIGEKGMRRMVNETINRPEFKENIKAQLQSTLKQLGSKTFYKTPQDCKGTELKGLVNNFVVSRTVPVGRNCILFPKFSFGQGFDQDTELVPFELYADDFDLVDFDFEIGDVSCQPGQCKTDVKLTKLSVTTSLKVEQGHKGSGQGLMENPSYIFEAKSKSRDEAAGVDIIVHTDANGRLDTAVTGFEDLRVSPDAIRLTPALRDDTGRILTTAAEKRDYIAKVKNRYRCELFRRVFVEQDKDVMRNFLTEEDLEQFDKSPDLYTFYLLQLQEWRFNAESEGKWFNDKDAERALEAFESFRKNPPSVKSFKCNQHKFKYSNYLPAFEEAGDLGEMSARGFSSPHSQLAFKGLIDTVNGGTFNNKRVIGEYIIPKIQKEVLGSAQAQLTDKMKAFAQLLKTALDRKLSLSINDLALESRIAAGNDEIERLKDLIKNTRGVGRNQVGNWKKRIVQLEETIAKLEREKERGPAGSLDYQTEYVLSKVGELNRISLLSGGVERCRDKENAVIGMTKESDLNGHEMAFELPMENIQDYLNEMHKLNPYMCAESVEPNCEGGNRLSTTQAPQFSCDKSGKCEVDVGTVTANKSILGIFEVNEPFDLKFEANLTRCEDGVSFCLKFGNAKVNNQSTLLDLKGFFGTSVEDETNAALTKFNSPKRDTSGNVVKMGGLDLSRLIPENIRQSFKFGDPIFKGDSIGIPLDLNKYDNRILLK